jgi:hypothetical protein
MRDGLRRRRNAATTPFQITAPDADHGRTDGAKVKRRILIMGLPGAGKTTLANALAPLINAVVFNADAVRANLSRDFGFTHEDRVDAGRFADTNCMFVSPDKFDLRVSPDGTPQYWAEQALARLCKSSSRVVSFLVAVSGWYSH